MRIDPQDGGLDDWIAPAPAPTWLAGQGAPVTAIDPRDGGLDDWIAPTPAPNRPAGQGASVMRIGPQSGLVPADPSQWWQTRALPRIIVHPKPPNASPDNPAGADGIDDWFVPGQAPAGTDGPDDWFMPTAARADTSSPDDRSVLAPSETPSTAQPAPGARPNAANPLISNPPALRPDTLRHYWSLIPASRVGAMAWHPPIFPNSLGQFPLPAPGRLSAPRIDATQGLLGALANLPAGNPAALPSFQPTGLALGTGDLSAPPSLFSSLANLPSLPPPAASGGGDNMGNSAVSRDRAGQFPFLDSLPFGAQPPLSAPPHFPPPMPNSQPPNPAAFPLLQQAGLTSEGSDQSEPQSPLQDPSDLHQLLQSNGSGDAEDQLAGRPSAAPATDPDESPSTTRVVRDSTGRALAIIHVQRAPSNEPLFKSDATPDRLRTGAKYAQINNAVTGNPVIDRTTDMLLAVLQQSIIAMGSGSGPLFGTRVHVDFGKRVEQLDLPGIGEDGVEQSFHLNFADFVNYGMDGSIRTDVVLRDPKNPSGAPIAVYDLKTGNAVLTPSRVAEIRRALKQGDLPIIMLHYRTGDAVNPSGTAPR
jgi:hypothetical protein